MLTYMKVELSEYPRVTQMVLLVSVQQDLVSGTFF